jgi:hypothetical protein
VTAVSRRSQARSFRPETDELWVAAQERAEAESTTVSAVLNAALRAYVEGEGAGSVEDRLAGLEARVSALETGDAPKR